MSRQDRLATFISATDSPGWVWFAKRLSANDTGASGSHQAGTYIPKPAAFSIFPSLRRADAGGNPKVQLEAILHELDIRRTPIATWYRERTRNEVRITQWANRQRGGAGSLSDKEATGALAVLAFYQPERSVDAEVCRVWVCNAEDAQSTIIEEKLIADRIGPLEPGEWVLYAGEFALTPESKPECTISRADPDFDLRWLTRMPPGEVIARLSFLRHPFRGHNSDKLLLARRECEYALFRSIEREHWGPKIGGPFATLEDFIAVAQSVLQSRKSRSGRSLEMHIRQCLIEHEFREGEDFEHGGATELGKVPDFLFPNVQAYNDAAAGRGDPSSLRMLAVKTTLKDRWRQVIDEAAGIPIKHLFTLQEGISDVQFQQIEASGIKLVVPAPLRDQKYKRYKDCILSLEQFIRELKETFA